MTKARDLASSGVTLTSTTTTADAALARAGGTMTGDLAMGTNLVDGVDVSARDAVLTSTTTLASAALPKSGGAMTGAITTNSTFDGVDIATRDAVLSSTTTTATNALNNANNALPKEGGEMTGPITTNSTFDGVDVGSRDSVLTSTTTTADAALPRTGGAMTGAITTNSTFDGVDIATRDAVLTSTTTTANAALPKAGGALTGDLTTNSDVSIGHASPTAPLDIRISGASGRIAEFHNTSGFGVDIGSDSDAVTYISGGYTQALALKTNAGAGQLERMRIDSSGNVGIGTSSPDRKFHIQTADNIIALIESTDADAWLSFQDNTSSSNNAVRVGATGDALRFYAGSAERMRIDSTGAVTMPHQPSFHVVKNTDQNNIATGTVVTVLWQVESYDVGANFASNTFTAPVAGKYILTASLRVDNSDSDSSHDDMAISTSNRLYKSIYDLGRLSGDPVYWSYQINAVADMDAGDTAFVTFFQTDGTAQADIKEDSGRTYFSGILVG